MSALPAASATHRDEPSRADLACLEHWLARFNAALQSANAGQLEGLFEPDSHWRDLLGLTWQIETPIERHRTSVSSSPNPPSHCGRTVCRSILTAARRASVSEPRSRSSRPFCDFRPRWVNAQASCGFVVTA